MFRIDLNRIAVTLWFFLGELAICGLLAVDAFTIQSVSAIEDLGFWAWTAVISCGVAAMSGFVIDAIRFVASAALPRKLPYRVKLKKVLKRNLA